MATLSYPAETEAICQSDVCSGCKQEPLSGESLVETVNDEGKASLTKQLKTKINDTTVKFTCGTISKKYKLMEC